MGRPRDPRNIHEAFKKERERQKLSQDALSKLAGIPYVSYVNIENGTSKDPKFSSIVKIAQALDIDLSILVNYVIDVPKESKK